MKFTRAWLGEHLDSEAPLATLTERLSAIGLEVEGVEDRGAALAPFRIAHVVEAARHPNADRLSACKVDAGEGIVSVVCGAPNARTGMKAVFAPPGSVIPGSGVTLKVGQIRGVESAGMLLSAREMGLGADHEGIVELPADAPVGAPYAAWAGLDDPVIEIAVTPNRGDALAVRGVARDLAAAGLGRLKPWAAAPVAGAFASRWRFAIEMPEVCPYVLGRTIRGLRNGASPRWLAERLEAVGLRPINALVDITNFFTIDLGRPLHVFDTAKLSGGVLTLRPGRGERFAGLHGREVSPGAEDCVIADAAGVQALAGVVGGEASGCDAGTREIFLECAWFDPRRIALTGRRHQIASDARARFERGIDVALMPAAVEAASRMILDLCGGEASEVVAAGTPPAWERQARLRFARLAELGGAAVAPERAVAILGALGFEERARDGASVTVAVPPWRRDVAAGGGLDLPPGMAEAAVRAAEAGAAAIEPEADLVEEVLRIVGLDSVPAVSLPRAAAVPAASLDPRQGRVALARRLLAGLGLQECVSFSFLAAGEAARFGQAPASLRLENPIASDLDQLRPTPLASLVLAAARNGARGFADGALFEIGPGFTEAAEGGQRLMAAGLRAGTTARHWAAPARARDAFDAKADALALLGALEVPMAALTVTTEAPAHYHPGRAGTIRQGPRLVLGHFGELHPALLGAMGISGRAAGFEVDFEAVAPPRARRRAAPALSPFQPLRRDFAFLVGREVAAEAVLRAARAAERELIAEVALFDVYEGPELAEGMRSLALEVVFQPREKSLTEAEIEAACARVVAAVAAATGARLR